jgi:hypothetical protein
MGGVSDEDTSARENVFDLAGQTAEAITGTVLGFLRDRHALR